MKGFARAVEMVPFTAGFWNFGYNHCIVYSVNDSCDFKYFDSPVGTLTVAATDSAVVFIGFGELTPPVLPPGGCVQRTTPFLEAVRAELDEWFSGQLRRFSVPVRLSGTPFQQSVWEAIAGIPYGACRSYGEIARAIGKPCAARAIGGACNRNPVPIIIPCHRVVGSNGALTGFGGGLDIKKALLAFEQGYSNKTNPVRPS